jgi:ABC-type nitrate/sulfonate/bicarbonate transport system substrate-binding protein
MTDRKTSWKRHAAGALAAAVLATALPAIAAAADPLNIRVGRGSAAEEQLWLMVALPSITPNQGKAYKIEMTLFRGTDKRFQAYEAGALDVITSSANSVMFAASQGSKMTMIASLSRETKKGFHTLYMVKDDSPLKSPKDLKDKLIGVNGLKSSIHMWAAMVAEKAGFDATKEVRFVPVPFPAQGEALRAGKIDVGAFPEPFAYMEQQKGGLRTLFTSKDAVPFDEELIVLVANPDFLAKNGPAVKAFLSDLVAATKYYETNRKEAQKALIDAKVTRIPADVYFAMPDYERDPTARIKVDSLKQMQDLQIKAGFQDKAVDVEKIVDLSYLPK